MSRNRLIRMVALAACSVVVGALGYSTPATAHIGASHAPYTTERLDLRSATWQSGPGNVKACFDQAVGAIPGSQNAGVDGYDAARAFNWPGGVGSIDADPNCVLLPVAPGTTGPSDIANQTIFVITQGFVTGTAGQQNTDGAVSLAGANAATARDHTDAPELQSAAPVAPTGVDYVFDRNIDEENGASANPADYGFQTAAGDTGTCLGGGAVTFSGNTVRVAGPFVPFGATPAAQCAPGLAVRFFTEPLRPAVAAAAPGTRCLTANDYAVSDRGTVRAAGPDANAKWNPLGVVGTGAAGSNAPGSTDDPDMTAATKTGTNTVDATFDEALVNAGAGTPVAACFIGYEADGDGHAATAAVVSDPAGASTTVRLTFNTLPTHQLQVLAAIPGAVTSSLNAGEPNSYGKIEFSDRLEPGFTDGGDLEQLTVSAAQNRATYCFDIDESLTGNFAAIFAPTFQLLDSSGSVIGTGNNVAGVADNCVTIGFPAAVPIGNAVAGGVNSNFGAQDDVGGNRDNNQLNVAAPGFGEGGPNWNARFAHVAVGGTPPTGAPPGPTPPPTPPTTPPGPPTVTTGLCDSNRATAAVAEILIGTGGPDNICGFGGDDLLRMRGGGDQGRGGPDNDTIAGQRGKDTSRGGPGNDVLRGGKGNDNNRGGPGDDTMAGGKGNDTNRGGKGDDTARCGKGRRDIGRAEVERGCER